MIMGSNMAECHPVGFRCVMEAQAARRDVIHVDPRFTRTWAMADLYVPIRAGTDIAFLGGLIHTSSRTTADSASTCVAYTNAVDDHRPRTSRTPRTSTASSPAWNEDSRSYDARSWQYEGMAVPRRRRPRRQSQTRPRPRPSGDGRQACTSGRRATGPDAAAPALRLPDPQAPLRPLHARDGGARSAAARASTFLKVAEALCDATPGRERTGAFCYAVGWTQHTSGAQIIRAAAILQLAARQHRPARRRHPGAARARLDPGLDRHPDALQPAARLPAACRTPAARTTTSRTTSTPRPAATGWWDNFPKYMRQPAEGLVRRRRRRRRTTTASTACRGIDRRPLAACRLMRRHGRRR